MLPMFVPVGLALLSQARWAQWTGGIGLLVMIVGFTVAFSGTLR